MILIGPFPVVSPWGLFIIIINRVIQNPDGTTALNNIEYYLFFAGAMLVTAIVFIPIAHFYQEKTYIGTPRTRGAPAGQKRACQNGGARPAQASRQHRSCSRDTEYTSAPAPPGHSAPQDGYTGA